MTVYERVGALGEWGLKITGAPKSIRDLIVPYSHVVIWPGRVYSNRLGDATALAGALYTGVVLKTPGRSGEIGGPGIAYWLGDSDNKGSIIESVVTFSAGTLSQWVTALMPSSLTAGTVTSPGGTVGGSYQWVTYRQALDNVCLGFPGVEWKINPNFTVDVATAANLYGSTPVAVALWAGGGSDNDYVGLDAEIVADWDWGDYASKVYVSGPNGRASSGGASTYRDAAGAATTRVRLEDSPDTPPGSEGAVAANLVAAYSDTNYQRELKIGVNRFAITRSVKPGQGVFVYDPEFGIAGSAVSTNVIRHQGRVLFPASVRAMGIRWPVQAPMGVLIRYYDGTGFSYADISDYVEYESGASTLEV